ncbi:hypothetical protein [Vibrio sinaloensis]|uniref:hypothetical protein n=1 Tax=Photobacterium sp. (strain ATCC 43367) TaxID=379097 RepID=UPI00057FCAC3|nr:chromosome partitioning protein ParA [Vibrio sinaloensis]
MRTSTLLTSVLLMSVSAMSVAQPDNIQTGFFIDAPVTGLHYQTSSQLSGQTEKGAFQYRPGDVISFYLGDNNHRYLLSTVSAQEVITPTSISTKPSRSINITRLLLSLDSTPENRKEILLLDSQLSNRKFQDNLRTLDLNQLVDADLQRLTQSQPASVSDAVEHLNESNVYIRDHFQSDAIVFEPLNLELQNVIVKQRDGNGRLCAYDVRLKNHPHYRPPIGSLTYRITADSVIEYPSLGDHFNGCQLQPSERKHTITTPIEHYPDDFGTFHCANRGCTRNDLNGFAIDDFNDEGDWKYRSLAINFDPTTQLLMEKSQGLGQTDKVTRPNKGEMLWFTYPKHQYTQIDYQGVWQQTTYQQGELQETCLLIEKSHIKHSKLIDGQCPTQARDYAEDVTHAYGDMWWVSPESPTASIEQLNLIVRWYQPKQPKPLYTTWEYLPAGKSWDKGVLYRYQQNLTRSAQGDEQLDTYSISEFVKVQETI